MRAALGLLTALPLRWDPDDTGGGWRWTPAVGLLMGISWLVFHQAFLRLGGPFVAAGGLLLLHQALTGARPLRGLAAVVTEVVDRPEQAPGRARPDVSGADIAVVGLVLLTMSSFLIRVDIAPAVLVVVPLVARISQVLLLSDADEVGLRAPGRSARLVITIGGLLALPIPAVLATFVRPVRLNSPVDGVGYLVLGAAALLLTLLVTWVSRAWLRARLGPLDANAWHAVGGIADLTALAVVASQVS